MQELVQGTYLHRVCLQHPPGQSKQALRVLSALRVPHPRGWCFSGTIGQWEWEGLIPAAGPGSAGRVNPTAFHTVCPLHLSIIFQPWTIEKP